jgi:hypothetical protein
VSRAPRARTSPLVRALLFAATVAFAPLALSAALFLRLPPEAKPLAPLGWPAAALRTAHTILLEPDGAHGLLVAPAPSPATKAPAASSAAPAKGPVLCRFELDTLRASPCHELELRPREAKNALHHAFGGGALLLVASEGGEGQPLALRAALVRPGEAPIVGASWSNGAFVAPSASLVNAAWNAHARRFEAYLARTNSDGAPDLFVLPFVGASAAPAPEPLARPGAGLANEALPMAVTASEPRGVLWATPAGAAYVRGDEQTILPCRDAPFACVLVASPLVPTGHYASSGSLWLDGRGQVKPLAPYFESPEHWRQIVHVVTQLSPDGASSPLASRSVSDELNFGRLEASDAEGNPVSVIVERRGFEEVLVVVDPRGARHRVARSAHAPYNWTVVPSAKGLALFDFSSARGVSLDTSYRALSPPERATTLREVLAHRFELGPLSVVAFLAALVAYPALALWAALARRKPSHPALAWSLAAYTVIVVIFLAQNQYYIFPP